MYLDEYPEAPPNAGSVNELWYCLNLANRERNTARTASAAWKAKCKAQKKRVQELLEVIKVIEWLEMGTHADGTPYIVCPYCQYENYHKDNCRLKLALNKEV